MKLNSTKLFILIAGLLALTSCDPAVKRYLGISKKAPDEYSVVKTSPLSIPPNFDLTPPTEESMKKNDQVKSNTNNQPLTDNDKVFLQKTTKATKKKQVETTEQN